jgi:tetratricopeptide (TPR) repeat protein
MSTICPTVYVGDSGELTAAAYSLGIPHNSGYPLYCLLGKLFCLIPLGNIGFRANVMSTFLGATTVWLTYAVILKLAASRAAALAGALTLAFLPAFWSQTVSAEVYALHAFFVVLLIGLLLWWEDSKEFYRLVLFTFAVGLSFGNHLQTVMLAPGVLWIVFSGDRAALLKWKNVVVLALLIGAPLLMYLYLPIRTDSGAAIHWGDPDTLDRFIAHVTGRAHRSGYVFGMGLWDYAARARDSALSVLFQSPVIVIFALWGWVKLHSRRWQVFFFLVVVFDFFYTVFLNTISLKVTPFHLPTLITLAILMGLGTADVLKKLETLRLFGIRGLFVAKAAFAAIPGLLFLSNYFQCDQSFNYVAYEHTQNMFRTVGQRNTLILDGDNLLFPAAYTRIAERAREDLTLYDRHGIIYPMPYLGEKEEICCGSADDVTTILEQEITKHEAPGTVFYAVFDENTVKPVPGYTLIPACLIHRVVKTKENDGYRISNHWRYYSNESYFASFERDYLTRELTAHYFLRLGKHLFLLGDPAAGLRSIRDASRIGYDDYGIHFMVSAFLADQGLFAEAQEELEKSSVYVKDQGALHNNWGYFYYKKGQYEEAVAAFQKASESSRRNAHYLRNLGHALYQAGRGEQAVKAFRKSLEIDPNQADIEKFVNSLRLGEKDER